MDREVLKDEKISGAVSVAFYLNPLEYENKEMKMYCSRGTQTMVSSFQARESKSSQICKDHNESVVRLQNHQRSEKFKVILDGKCTDQISQMIVLKSFAGILLGILFTSTITLLPHHDVIDDPKYWYESIYVLAIGFPAAASGYMAYNFFYLLNIDLGEPWRMTTYLFLSGMFTAVICVSTCYILWSKYLGYPYPIPFQGYMIGNVIWSTMIITSWFLFPNHWRQNVTIRNRIKYCILLAYVASFIEISYKLYAELFIIVPQNYQWTIAIVLFLAREANDWIFSIIIKRISGFDDISSNMIANHFASARHALFISLVIGRLASNETSYFLLGTDFLANVYLCFRIVILNDRASESSKKKKMETIMALIINETVEFLVPIAYCITITMAYYGPSGQVIGNIKNSYWQYSAINNMENTLQWLAIFFFVDLMSLIISVVLLLVICKINLIKIYFQLLKEAWLILAVHQAYLLEEVSSLNMSNELLDSNI